jgi:protein gp37
MGDKTGISWTDATWNPITGCSRVSEGCRNCYAERFAHRFSGKGQRYEGLTQIVNGHPAWTGVVEFNEKALLKPLSWKSPRRIFVNSMSDLFHENVTDEQRDRIFSVMTLCPHHTFQVLTKRPQMMMRYLQLRTTRSLIYMAAVEIAAGIKMERPHLVELPLSNVWLGTSVENQNTADERIPFLIETPAAVKFLSCEPLLGPIEFKKVPGFNRMGLDLSNWWVICGGESGPGARPMNLQWARRLRDQCKNALVPFFFKQWGEWAPSHPKPSGTPGRFALVAQSGDEGYFDGLEQYPRQFSAFGSIVMERIGTRKAGDLLDGVQHHEYPRGTA